MNDKQEILRELLAAGESIHENLWTDDQKKKLQVIAQRMAEAGQRWLAAEPAMRKEIQEELLLLRNHVCLMALSQLDVAENTARQALPNILNYALGLLLNAATHGALGKPAPAV